MRAVDLTPLNLPSPLTDEECADFNATAIAREIADFVEMGYSSIDRDTLALIKNLLDHGMPVADVQTACVIARSRYHEDVNIYLHNLLLLAKEANADTSVEIWRIGDAVAELRSVVTGQLLAHRKMMTVGEVAAAYAVSRFIALESSGTSGFSDDGNSIIYYAGLHQIVESRPDDTDRILAYVKDRLHDYDSRASALPEGFLESLVAHLDAQIESPLVSGWL